MFFFFAPWEDFFFLTNDGVITTFPKRGLHQEKKTTRNTKVYKSNKKQDTVNFVSPLHKRNVQQKNFAKIIQGKPTFLFIFLVS